jgi:hypothetical protein
MIVYGDPQFRVNCTAMVSSLQARLAVEQLDLDSARDLLIAAGQFEQAIADYGENQPPAKAAQQLTDCAAALFYATYSSLGVMAHEQPARQSAKNILHVTRWPDADLTVKVPEGFAFYALFPEQYVIAALKWQRQRQRGTVLVIGLRSIGTTLSAVVATTLSACGWEVQRITVRPSGDPFQRNAVLPPTGLQSEFVLVVDEGPGASGSSMASVVRALMNSGVQQQKITLMPGHAGPPGSAADPEVLHWWKTTDRITPTTDEPRWNGLSLNESLVAKTSELCRDEVISVENLSGGLWRSVAYTSQTDWPAVAPQFERTKLLCRMRRGGGVLWKFSGLGPTTNPSKTAAFEEFDQILTCSERGFCPAPLGLSHGFVALPWIHGIPLQAKDVDDAILQRMCDYLRWSAGPPLSESEAFDAMERLKHMFYWNCQKALGDEYADLCEMWSNDIRPPKDFPSYTDGRMALHEWIRTTSGEILKTDVGGHTCDHTMVGPQPLYWDFAGALIEWNIESTRAGRMLNALLGISIDNTLLEYFCGAYAAFRLGQTLMSKHWLTDKREECRRLQSAAVTYGALLKNLLNKSRRVEVNYHSIREFDRSRF